MKNFKSISSTDKNVYFITEMQITKILALKYFVKRIKRSSQRQIYLISNFTGLMVRRKTSSTDRHLHIGYLLVYESLVIIKFYHNDQNVDEILKRIMQ